MQTIFKMRALEDAKAAKVEALMTGVCLLILMGSVNIFAQNMAIVEIQQSTKLVLTVVNVELQVISELL